MNLKRVLAVGITTAVVLGTCMVPAGAVAIQGESIPPAAAAAWEGGVIVPFSSTCITGYNAYMSPGDQAGTLKINYTVSSSKQAKTIGVSRIDIYKSNGVKVTTITGSVANGLLREFAGTKTGSYVYRGTAGTTYYAKVTLQAVCGTERDSRTVTTEKVTIR